MVGNEDVFLPSVGIVMGQTSSTSNSLNATECRTTLTQKQNLLNRVDSAQLDSMQLASIMQTVPCMGNLPEIQVGLKKPQLQQSQRIFSYCFKVNSKHLQSEEPKLDPPKFLKLDHQQHSHSSSEIDDPSLVIEHKEMDRSVSDYEIHKNSSDSGFGRKLPTVASPVSTAKELFSPLSKLAKGVQTFGANLDPRKLSGHGRQVSARDVEEHRKLQEKWVNSKCRLIAL